MECYACSNEATRQCRRCARVYCELHGGDLCAECLKPASALPSFNLYRGSLLALLVGTAVALWLLVRPPGSGNGGGVVIPNFTPTVIVTQQNSTATVARTTTPAATAPAGASATPGAATPTAPPEQPTATAAVRTYAVQSGDTLLGIAERFAPPGVSPFDYVNEIVAASGLGSSSDILSTGQTLVLP